jgi:hypothetical protein
LRALEGRYGGETRFFKTEPGKTEREIVRRNQARGQRRREK